MSEYFATSMPSRTLLELALCASVLCSSLTAAVLHAPLPVGDALVHETLTQVELPAGAEPISLSAGHLVLLVHVKDGRLFYAGSLCVAGCLVT